MDIRYYRVIIACGHVGSGKIIEITRYFEAIDTIHCYYCAQDIPRSKKKSSSIKLIEPITINEYQLGKQLEDSNYYLHTFSYKGRKIS